MSGINQVRLQAAIAAADINSYIPFDDPALGTELISTSTPEDFLVEKERYQEKESIYSSMSDEARQIIDIILNAPQEMASILFTPKGRLAKGANIQQRLISKLAHQWKDVRYAKKVVAEIQEYVQSFE